MGREGGKRWGGWGEIGRRRVKEREGRGEDGGEGKSSYKDALNLFTVLGSGDQERVYCESL